MLANIALDSLEQMLERHGMRFVRCADDFFVMCRNHTQAEEALALGSLSSRKRAEAEIKPGENAYRCILRRLRVSRLQSKFSLNDDAGKVSRAGIFSIHGGMTGVVNLYGNV